MDFYQIKETPIKNGIGVGPNFLVGVSKDFMVRGRTFYAIWNGEVWSTDEFDVQRLIDNDLESYIQDQQQKNGPGTKYIPLRLRDFKTNGWREYRNFVSLMPDTNKQLDSKLVFANDKPKRSDYSSKRLNYDIREGDCSNYDELMSVLFSPEERLKLEWAVGSVLAGDSKTIQKFIVLYGEGGTGKSTFLNIVQQLFDGYYITFDARSLVNGADNFSTEMFKSNPLVAIEHDSNLSKIADNTKLNAIIAHEDVIIKEKFKPSYTIRANAFVFLGTNSPIMITDSHSGIIRRLIDVYPTGNKHTPRKYTKLFDGIKFELGAIAFRCHQVYSGLGKNYYNGYQPLAMMYKTDVFYNFVEDNYFLFLDQDGCTLKQAYDLYKIYCTESSLKYIAPKYKFKDELKAYFMIFEDRSRDDLGQQIRNQYKVFRKERFVSVIQKEGEDVLEESITNGNTIVLNNTTSIFDKMYANSPAQYASTAGTPKHKWEVTTTKISEIDTGKLHYVKLPENHIVVDFDIKDDAGNKSLKLNLEAAVKWPPTYSELSKSENGIHLHYIYDGDATSLSRIYSEGIEVKVFIGNSSLRRKLSKCNDLPIAHISSGLPKGEKQMINPVAIKSERGLRYLIQRNLNKEIHPGTKPSVDFIHKILEDAYSSGLIYDLSDMRNRVLAFSAQSTNQSEYCVRLVSSMRFKSENDNSESPIIVDQNIGLLTFFDVEVFPNLFIIVWKEEGVDKQPVVMVNPGSQEIERLFSMKLVGFNNRRYDNHILYAGFMGYDNTQIYNLSKKIVNDDRGGMFGEAYNLSYTDIYDFSSKKQSLKKFEIELGIHHQELPYDWDKPIPEEFWPNVIQYCINDVNATEAVFNDHRQDYIARLILADISKLTPNHTTQSHTAQIIFGNDSRPQSKFVYTDLSETFPGYTYDPTRQPKSLYRGEEPSEGGYVYSKTGIWKDVSVYDVASMHPTSLIELNLFGPYTVRYKELVEARLAIKHKQYDKARNLLGGVLGKYLNSTDEAKELSFALKIVVNIVYGLTSAKFDNKFLDVRNRDNIVAKRGALFMIELKHAVQEQGFEVVHIKTDSIKIASANDHIRNFIYEFGRKYNYVFEHESTYSKFCLINDAVFIAKYGWSDDNRNIGSWTATGAQFGHSYVYKKLFTKDPILFEDLCEVKSVKSIMYLDYNEQLGDNHNYVHVGKVGSFVPMIAGVGAGVLLREDKNQYYAVTGTKGYLWLPASVVKENGLEGSINMSYFDRLASQAKIAIEKYGIFEEFLK